MLCDYEHLAQCLRLSIAEQGLSFAEFLDYLLVIDIANCDDHFRQQWHRIEEHVLLHRVINVNKESLLSALDEFERQLALTPVKPKEREDMLSQWRQTSSKYHSLERPNHDFSAVRFRRRAEGAISFPATKRS